jgi:hypothetical protein
MNNHDLPTVRVITEYPPGHAARVLGGALAMVEDPATGNLGFACVPDPWPNALLPCGLPVEVVPLMPPAAPVGSADGDSDGDGVEHEEDEREYYSEIDDSAWGYV